MKITVRKTADLIPYINNARTHDESQVIQIASSIKEFGFTNPILIDEQGGIIAGHGRLLAAQKLNLEEVPTITLDNLTDAQKKAYVIADNKLALNAGWDFDLLKVEIEGLQDLDFDVDLLGFDSDELDDIFQTNSQVTDGLTNQNDIPESPEQPVNIQGDVWTLGSHRLMCGDSTDKNDIKKLMNGEVAELLHADPPYGMGKEGQGVVNDNLYREKLDDFQYKWIVLFNEYLSGSGSIYIWGNSYDLWRLWFYKINDIERFTFRNQIIWNKETGQGINSETHRMYATVTEHCLFFVKGEQGFNINADNYWDGWDSVRLYLCEQKEKSGLQDIDFKKIAGHKDSRDHWFTKSQWMMPTEKVYKSWQIHFSEKKEYDVFKKEYDVLKKEYDVLKKEFYSTRAHFNNTHEMMTDVWSFPRVKEKERFSHATPKPVEMMERIQKTSLQKNGICIEPFGGSGSTLIACEKTGRHCYTMEISENYCDVIIERWQNFTGQEAKHEETGKTFSQVKKERM